MSRTLRLMEETDLPQVAAAFAEALAPRRAACGINWQHDDERLILLVETDVPAAEIGEVYRGAVAPLLGRLEGEFGEFSLEIRSLCACGTAATPMISGDNPEYDMCLCAECLDRRIDSRREGPRNTCPVCEAGFDSHESPGWRADCSAKLVSEEGGAEPEMDIETIRIGRGADGTSMDRWDCCSRKCALEQFRRWLSEVESHPVAKEARL